MTVDRDSAVGQSKLNKESFVSVSEAKLFDVFMRISFPFFKRRFIN